MAIVAAVSDPYDFWNGRHFSAQLGLAPKQQSSSDKTQLLGISKRGDYRSLFANVIDSWCQGDIENRTPSTKKYARVLALKARCGSNHAIVAIANKMVVARIGPYQKAMQAIQLTNAPMIGNGLPVDSANRT